jgi:hypothetical protein
MTLSIHFSLRCTNCNRLDYTGDGPDSAKELREQAASDGWTYERVQNGSMWDWCPACIRLGKNKPADESNSKEGTQDG